MTLRAGSAILIARPRVLLLAALAALLLPSDLNGCRPADPGKAPPEYDISVLVF